MSSTNRGGKRTPADYYPTPAWCVHRLLEAASFPGGRWLEVAAGEGAIIRAVDERRQDVEWTAVELRAKCKAPLAALTGARRRVRITNFLALEPAALGERFDLAITNPPYSVGMEMVEHSFGFADRVVMLLRLNFLASAERAPFMHRYPPDVYVMPNRPSFSGKGTDSIEYAWFVWHPGKRRKVGRLTVLPVTPRAERASARPSRR